MYYSSARTAFSGFLITAAAGFALIYHLGVRPSAREASEKVERKKRVLSLGAFY